VNEARRFVQKLSEFHYVDQEDVAKAAGVMVGYVGKVEVNWRSALSTHSKDRKFLFEIV